MVYKSYAKKKKAFTINDFLAYKNNNKLGSQKSENSVSIYRHINHMEVLNIVFQACRRSGGKLGVEGTTSFDRASLQIFID
jgi:hypothetical protein